MKNQRGFSMIEVIVATASVGIVIYSYLQVRELESQLLTRVNFSQNLSEVVVANVNEVKTKSKKLMPMPGDCLVRYYSLEGEFQSEQKIFSTDSRCGNSPLTGKVIEVIWKISGGALIQANFEPARFLKLPTLNPSLLQVEIKGRVVSPPPGPPEQSLEAVIFVK